MEKQNSSGRPEVYALRQDGENWQISRREFLKAAGLSAAVAAIGLDKAKAQEISFYDACLNAAAHKSEIEGLIASVDMKYLISISYEDIKCWDFENLVLLGRIPITTYTLFAKYYNGRSCLFLVTGYREYTLFQIYELPLTPGNFTELKVPSYRTLSLFEFDSSENMYALGNDENIYFYSKESNYQEREMVFENPDGHPIVGITLFDQDKKMVVRYGTNRDFRDAGLGILDLDGNSMTLFDMECRGISILDDQNQALIRTVKEYSLISLDDGSVLWSHFFPDVAPSSGFVSIEGLRVLPDHTKGLLVAGYEKWIYKLFLFSITDGSLLNSYTFNGLAVLDEPSGIIITPDGTKCVISVGKHIMYFSLPDLKLIGCPVDLEAMTTSEQCVEITGIDAHNGKKYANMLPCGPAIPDGAVCTCNCVSGKLCTCDSHNNTGHPHYWHPN